MRLSVRRNQLTPYIGKTNCYNFYEGFKDTGNAEIAGTTRTAGTLSGVVLTTEN